MVDEVQSIVRKITNEIVTEKTKENHKTFFGETVNKSLIFFPPKFRPHIFSYEKMPYIAGLSMLKNGSMRSKTVPKNHSNCVLPFQVLLDQFGSFRTQFFFLTPKHSSQKYFVFFRPKSSIRVQHIAVPMFLVIWVKGWELHIWGCRLENCSGGPNFIFGQNILYI